MRPTWAEISLTKLRRNFRAIQQRVGPVAICAVVKADAYGHGVVECARTLEEEGARWLGVTSTEEGIRLREAGIHARILLMSGFWRGEESEVVRHSLTPAVWDRSHIEQLESAATAQDVAGFPVHLKVDTGMTRLGASWSELPEMLEVIRANRRIQLEAVFTHLASSEVLDAPDAAAQLRCFEEIRSAVCARGMHPSFHAANTAAIASRPKSWFNMVRPGISLYGYQLDFCGDVQNGVACPLPVEPVLSWKTRVISTRDVAAGCGIGYGASYVTTAPTRVAVLPIGYADGLNRKLSSAGRVMIGGAYAPIIGRVSMDLTTVDITAVAGVNVGDEVTILGENNGCRVDAWDHARIAGTIPYEILCNISKRVPRSYFAAEPPIEQTAPTLTRID